MKQTTFHRQRCTLMLFSTVILLGHSLGFSLSVAQTPQISLQLEKEDSEFGMQFKRHLIDEYLAISESSATSFPEKIQLELIQRIDQLRERNATELIMILESNVSEDMLADMRTSGKRLISALSVPVLEGNINRAAHAYALYDCSILEGITAEIPWDAQICGKQVNQAIVDLERAQSLSPSRVRDLAILEKQLQSKMPVDTWLWMHQQPYTVPIFGDAFRLDDYGSAVVIEIANDVQALEHPIKVVLRPSKELEEIEGQYESRKRAVDVVKNLLRNEFEERGLESQNFSFEVGAKPIAMVGRGHLPDHGMAVSIDIELPPETIVEAIDAEGDLSSFFWQPLPLEPMDVQKSNHRITDSAYAYLSGDEKSGYGLYTYVLLPSRDNRLRSKRLLQEVIWILHADDWSFDPSKLNVFHIPVVEGMMSDARRLAFVSIENFLDEYYDYAFSSSLIARICENPPKKLTDLCSRDYSSGGPFLFTYVEPVGRVEDPPPPYLFFDLSGISPRAFSEYVRAYKSQVKRLDYTDEKALREFRLVVLKLLSGLADHTRGTIDSMDTLIHLIRKE